MAANPLPAPLAICELVSMLVGNRVKVTPCGPLPVPQARGVATYIDKEQKLVFVAITDMAFLAGVGAALALIPAAMVAEAVKTGKLSEALQENAFEVMNIVSSLYNDVEGKGTHVKIQRLVVAPPLPPELAPRLAKPTARRDVEVQVPGYASGKLTLLAVA